MSSIFFLMNRRLPTSTLFPYTTLFRSVESLPFEDRLTLPQPQGVDRETGSLTVSAEDTLVEMESTTGLRQINAPAGALARSEEHTSELQSQSNLVCRLLLEKKKKKNTI